MHSKMRRKREEIELRNGIMKKSNLRKTKLIFKFRISIMAFSEKGAVLNKYAPN